MHPIERLRFLAGLDPSRVDLLGREAAGTLLACAGDPAELVVACRRLLDRHPAAGPLWWVASTALTATDPYAALGAALHALEDDATEGLAERELDRRQDAVAVTAWSFGADGAFADAGEVEDALDHHATGGEIVVVGGVGRALPAPVWRAVVDRVAHLETRPPALLPWDGVTLVVGPTGPAEPPAAVRAADCPVASELLRPTPPSR